MTTIPESIMREAAECWETLTHTANTRDAETAIIACAIQAAEERGRNEGLEAAAKVADENAHEECEVAEVIAAAIRALKTKETAE